MPAQYIAKQLELYKSGQRKNAVMQGMAANLSDSDMKALGSYYFTQRATPNAKALNKELADAGQKIYRMGIPESKVPACSGCHGGAGGGTGTGADADQNDGQAAFNAARKAQATALLGFISTVQTAANDLDVLVIGDLNSYTEEDPIDILRAGGLINLDNDGYSYVFNGQAGSLDHALATPSLAAQIAATSVWHINADEPRILDYNVEFKNTVGCTTSCTSPDYYAARPASRQPLRATALAPSSSASPRPQQAHLLAALL